MVNVDSINEGCGCPLLLPVAAARVSQTPSAKAGVTKSAPKSTSQRKQKIDSSLPPIFRDTREFQRYFKSCCGFYQHNSNFEERYGQRLEISRNGRQNPLYKLDALMVNYQILRIRDIVGAPSDPRTEKRSGRGCVQATLYSIVALPEL
jgi:hypothetical protein